ncbi:MAG: DNA-directed RNA polymerase subunit omega [Alphaproteobacteria bacterium MedPE-SWcel]|nr:MAG: DNA-directed RNA polymerase subunit omega [Alphaproteobacteria bacterium MedPE-SWcel]
MVFRRRDRRPPLRAVAEFLWPRGGWGRAFHYVKHRVRRLPDSPERIARGIGVGLFTTFTPFYGVHFVVAAILARGINGNLLAALSATFFGNPLTYVPIGVISLQTGHWLLGSQPMAEVNATLADKFLAAGGDLWFNLSAFVSGTATDWTGLVIFYHEVFYPYLIGGLIPGLVAGTVGYIVSVPLIRSYQERRKRKIKAKFEAIKKRAELEAVNSPHAPRGTHPPSSSPRPATPRDRAPKASRPD